ncbi:MAG: hypothetical protein J6O88_17870 [Chryseobacterium sp.]|uniref:hypothetical protein n=1 Tax=Chryseobacterium sp. TaxID=1871047 RepID=UPI001B26C759|nr:hypothetical protein [Chryseobacterium sp.]MBO6186527.1 hypothetical protein [Chryseobacterium sp.]
MSNNNLTKDEIKFYESLFILYKSKQAINNLWSKLKQNDGLLKGFEYSDTPLLYHIILEVVNFNEEYNLYFNKVYLNIYQERVQELKDINKPIFKKINQWRLKDFRNNIIAHTWRNKNKFTHPDSDIYLIPKNALEFSLLVNYINYAWSIIENEFEIELNHAINYMISIASNIQKRNKDYNNLNDDQIKLVEEVNLKCMEYKKSYHLSVYLFDFSEIQN